MRNKFLLFEVLFILSSILILNISLVTAETKFCIPSIKLSNQDPNPAVPNEYVKVIFEISNLGNCNGLSIKLNQEYPFSLDSNDSAVQSVETNPYVSGYRNVWIIPYKVRVDSAAFNGDYNLNLQYKEGGDIDFSSMKGFNISIQDSRTEFDAVIQEISGSDVSIAIANVGKYTANSVVVRIPEQEYFSVNGVEGQMLGNLESGDYTIAGFSISSKSRIAQQSINKSGRTPDTAQQKPNQLKFDVYYTDNIGKRRVVNMELLLNIGNIGNSSLGGIRNFNIRKTSTSTSLLSNWYTWVIILVILIVLYLKYPQQVKNSINKIFRSSTKKADKFSTDNKIPSWVKNAKEKEKKK